MWLGLGKQDFMSHEKWRELQLCDIIRCERSGLQRVFINYNSESEPVRVGDSFLFHLLMGIFGERRMRLVLSVIYGDKVG